MSLTAQHARHINRKVGEALRARRKHLKLSQVAMGEVMGVGRTAYQKYETGITAVPAPALLMAADALGVPVAFFFAGLGGDQAAESNHCTELRRLTPQQRTAVGASIRAFQGGGR